MLEKFDEFANKKKNIDSQKKQLKQKIAGLNQQKLQVKIDKFNKQKQEINKKINPVSSGQGGTSDFR